MTGVSPVILILFIILHISQRLADVVYKIDLALSTDDSQGLSCVHSATGLMRPQYT